MQRKILVQYYVLSGLLNYCGLLLTSAVYVTFLMHHGLTLMQVNLVNAAFFFSLFICEIPTGAFADIFGRKRAFVLSCLMMALAKSIYGCSHTISWFIVAEICAAIAYTFYNGAFQAWLVDSLKHSGYEGEFTRIFARQSLINQICGSLGAITGAYLYTLGSSIPWFAGASMLLALSFAADRLMREDYFERKTLSIVSGFQSMRDVAVKSLHYGMNHKPVRFVLIVTFIQIFAVQSLNMYWQPFFKAKGMNEGNFGYVFTGMMAALALGSFIVFRMKTDGNEKKLIVVSLVVAGLLIAIAAYMSTLSLALVFFIMHEIPRGFWVPLKEGYLQKRIPSSERATISSFCAIAPHIGGAIGLVVSGVIAEYCGISFVWMFSGLVMVVGSIFIARNGKE